MRSLKEKKIVLEELDRTMINEMNLPKFLWADAINTACHVFLEVLDRTMINEMNLPKFF